MAPLGAKGVGEPPCISTTPAIVAAIRDAIGKDLTATPVRPQRHRLLTPSDGGLLRRPIRRAGNAPGHAADADGIV